MGPWLSMDRVRVDASGTVGIIFQVSLSHYIFQTLYSQCFVCSYTRSAGDVRVQLLCCKYMHANELKMVVPNVFLPARGLLHSVSCFSCIYWPCRKTSEFADKPRPNNTRGKPKPVGLLSFPPAATNLAFLATAVCYYCPFCLLPSSCCVGSHFMGPAGHRSTPQRLAFLLQANVGMMRHATGRQAQAHSSRAWPGTTASAFCVPHMA